MSRKRPARKGTPDLRQQKHVPSPPIEEIDKQLYSLLSPGSFKPLKLCEGKDKKKLRRRSPPQALRILRLPVMMVVTAFTHNPVTVWYTANSRANDKTWYYSLNTVRIRNLFVKAGKGAGVQGRRGEGKILLQALSSAPLPLCCLNEEMS